MAHPSLAGDWKTQIGYKQLQMRLGAAMPSGSTVAVTQVEMSVNEHGDYLPDLRDSQFAGKNISTRSGTSGVSSHATTVAEYYFGAGSSLCPGIRAASLFDANDWAEEGCLNIRSALEPARSLHLVENHSWVGSFGVESIDEDALRRIDYLVTRDGVLVTAGVKNGAGTPMPRLVCSGYNVLSVGLTNAESSYGPTRVEGRRVKPDVVAPLSATSWATPVVAGCGSLLIESMDALGSLRAIEPSLRRAARPLLCKALLMGGASKEEWADWRKGFEVPCSDGTVPLDYRYGAGEVDLANSYRILAAGHHSSGSIPLTGWSLQQTSPADPRTYTFDVPNCRTIERASILLTWNRRIRVTRGSPLAFTPTLANLRLRLLRIRDGSVPVEVDLSDSRVDNVEHIFVRDLPGGTYALEVTGDQAWEYCLTWDVVTRMTPSCPDKTLLVRSAEEQAGSDSFLVTASAGEADSSLVEAASPGAHVIESASARRSAQGQ